MSPLRRLRFDARVAGAMLCAGGFALFAHPALLASALAIELLAAGFWCWARVSEDAAEQVARWSWLRRPAAALWLAVAVHAAAPELSHAHPDLGSVLGPLLTMLEAGATAWAGLELLAGLPLARPYSDLPGPFLGIRPWLPVLLPTAGFLVLWRQWSHWIAVDQVRDAAGVLLLVTALLAGLRAFARRSWTASLRWAVVADSALAGMLLATRAVSPTAVFVLWLAAAGGHALLLAGELRGAVTRRGAINARLWRGASWLALAALALPILVGPRIPTTASYYAPAAALPVALMAWSAVRRLTIAAERRRMVRVDLAALLSPFAALVIAGLALFGLALAWWFGFEPSWRVALTALAPAALGAVAAISARRLGARGAGGALERVGGFLPDIAGKAYLWFVAFERRLVALLSRVAGGAAAALHGLHTGDAQEYLLFLVGVAVLALLIPLLQ